ncbi:heptaprenylglyceryl phosphate synthase [Chengkuizengella marina]|uniref:Heptaprenylglyceryl phosphate synthase n=1 Tax=Chengkuizengella marina TaxID=2507566 RepID=A0A6N9Q9H4_9BACL|nr:heptaprenylglyceryl phosphate synthase [Chengkuizengella marina]NBI31273.1 heptaprenylglyceryl phosphate synthase [Chengkuizengella marina]
MKSIIKNWNHIFKLDPDKKISDDHLAKICSSGTDAIMVGGSSGITYENTYDLFSRIQQYSIPTILEVSNQDAIVIGFDLYMIPIVLNASDAEWIIGNHQRAIKKYGDIMPWENILTEAYVSLNPDATVTKVTNASTDLNEEDVLSYARCAEQLFHMPIFYVEYSGVFGNIAMLKNVKKVLTNTQFFYGGGINNIQKALMAAKVADTIIVGNAIYNDIELAIETVKIKDEMPKQ